MLSYFRCVKCLEWYTNLPSTDYPQESPVFLMYGNEWFFRFVLHNVESPRYGWYVKVYLELKSKKNDFEIVRNTFYVGFKTENVLSLGQGSFMLSKNFEIWSMRMDDLQAKLPLDYMSGNNIKFLFSFDNVDESALQIVKETDEKSVQIGSLDSYLNVDVPPESLSKDFSKLLDADWNHDVEIKCGDHCIKAHKIVLSARSDVFKAMLESHTREGRTNIIDIQDIDANCLQDFVRYVYTDVLPELTCEKALALYEAGDKYAIESIMFRCSEYLQDNLSLENAFKCFALADAHSDQKLKAKITRYILDEEMYRLEKYWSPFCESFPKDVIEIYKLSYKNRENYEESVRY